MKFEVQLETDEVFERELRRIVNALPPSHGITSHIEKASISFIWSDTNNEEHGIKFAVTIHKSGHIVIGFNNHHTLIVSKDFKFNISAVNELIQYTIMGIFTQHPDSICHYINNVNFAHDTQIMLN